MNGVFEKDLMRCPVCGAALCLSEDGKTVLCPARHAFDVARQGYVNLLTADRRASRAPGDSPEMIAARTRFLSGGFYEPFSDAVCRVLGAVLPDAPVVADAGCGEGYYTVRMARALYEAGKQPTVFGFDLAKSACAHAAVLAREVPVPMQFAVASLFSMPLADGSCDAVMNLFAPCAEEEFARVLSQGGYLLEAVPAERHLFEMKEILYDTPYENEVRRDEFRLFNPVSVTPVRYTFRPGERMADLLLMTPYFWRTSKEGKARLAAAEDVTVTAAFDLLLYQRKETFDPD